MANHMAAGKNDDDDADDNKLNNKALPYQQYEAIRNQRILTYYLSTSIVDPHLYTDMIHKIRTAQPQDIIYLHLNTPGGRLDTGMQIINAMKDSQARIVGVLDSKAYSLGTLIFLAADEFIVHDNCMFMIHNFSGAVVGKGNDQHAELAATLSWFKKLATKYYVPFLSPQELGDVLNGRDLWMDSDEVTARLQEMVKAQQKAAKKAAKAAKVPVVPTKNSPLLENGQLPQSSTQEVAGNSGSGSDASNLAGTSTTGKYAPMRISRSVPVEHRTMMVPGAFL